MCVCVWCVYSVCTLVRVVYVALHLHEYVHVCVYVHIDNRVFFRSPGGNSLA